MDKKQIEIANWGNYPRIQAEYHELEFLDNIRELVSQTDSILARGNGRCYGDASLNSRVLSTLKLDKLLSFDVEKRLISCQAGVLLSDLLDFIIPKGFFLPVSPGTKCITVGGAIAADVHGKNHHKEGCFSKHLISFDLMRGDGQVHHCSPTINAELFWATVGGMGLTGIIINACFKLKSIETSYIKQESIQAKNLAEIIQLFEESMDWTYVVAWIDCLQTGDNLGKSILIRGEHAILDDLPLSKQKNPLKTDSKNKLTIPKVFPSWSLNNFTVKVFNYFYYRKQFSKQRLSFTHYDKFFYPLDALLAWNRIYGKVGFTQYQFVIPKEQGKQALVEILNVIRASKQGSFLTVLKLFGKANPLAYKSFPIEGYTLSLDFKISKQLPSLILKLDELVARYNGKVYLAKDAFSSSKLFNSSHLKQKSPTFNSIQADRLFSSSERNSV